MTAACGIDCDVCELKPECRGCPPGTDPGARDRLDELQRLIGFICPVLRCAIEKNVDYCIRCQEFPCNIHYKYNYPYSDLYLDDIKVMTELRSEFGSDRFHEVVLKTTLKHRKPKQ